MRSPALQAFIDDVKVESVKFRLQTSVAHSEVQHNDIIGNFEYSKQDSETVAKTLGKALKDLENLSGYGYHRQLANLVQEWNEKRITIQYEGYGYGDSNARRSEAYSYVLLLRILKKKHKDLWGLVKELINT